MTTRLRNYINEDELDRAKNNGLIETKYKGARKDLFGKRGHAYHNIPDGQWYFIYQGEEYRVSGNSLDCIGVN